ERFADDKIHAGHFPVSGLKHLGIGSDQRDWLARAASLDGHCQLITSHAWHGKVSDNKMVTALLDLCQSILGVAGSFYNMTIKVQHHSDGVANQLLVIYNQDAFVGKGRARLRHICAALWQQGSSQSRAATGVIAERRRGLADDYFFRD